MKKGLQIFAVVCLFTLSIFTLMACTQENKEFMYDGLYTAYEYTTDSKGAPQITFVTVEIKNDKIVSYSLDTRQGTSTFDTTGEGENVVKTQLTGEWNDKTKKELKFDYGMSAQTGNKEWFEQAKLIEDYWLENGIDAVTIDESTDKITNITGVSIKGSTYNKIAKQAVENAKNGVLNAFICTKNGSISLASANVDKKGNITEYKLDEVQLDKTSNTSLWSFGKTKYELKFDYGMADKTGGKEWFEQADFIASEFEKGNEINVENGKFVSSGASISDNSYIAVLTAVKNCVK